MKTHVHSAGELTPQLSKAILLYESHDLAYATVHEAGVKNGRAELGAGVPASRAAIAGLAQKLLNATALSGFIPARLLYLSPRAIAWRRPAESARMFFQCDPARDKGLIGARSAVTLQPELVFAVSASDWYVWALDYDPRVEAPGPGTRLFRAPHFNVWQDGRICTGNVKLPQSMSPEVLAEYEAAFFGSNFTHPNDPKGFARYPGGPYALWRDLLDGKKHTVFPSHALAPTKMKLADAINRLEAPWTRVMRSSSGTRRSWPCPPTASSRRSP